MSEHGTLRLDTGEEIRVVVERDDLKQDEFTVRRVPPATPASGDLLRAIDEHLATATPHPAGTTDRLRSGDRERGI